jgi:histone-arginine methyltransferase CARM1
MREFTIPLSFTATATGLMHGIAGWFDVIFMGSELTKQLTTSPSNDTTHWYQMRFILNRPFAVNRGQRVTGTLHFEANDQRSHNLHLKLKLEGTEVETEARYSLHDQTYWNLSGASTASPESQGIYTRFLNS